MDCVKTASEGDCREAALVTCRDIAGFVGNTHELVDLVCVKSKQCDNVFLVDFINQILTQDEKLQADIETDHLYVEPINWMVNAPRDVNLEQPTKQAIW